MYANTTEALFARTIPGTDYCDILYDYEGGTPVTTLDLPMSDTVYPRDSERSCRHEHPEGITLTHDEAEWLGIEFED